MRSENSPWQAIYPVGDGALLLEFGAAVDLAINQRVHRVARALHAAALPGVWGIVPAFAAILVEFDPLVTDRQTITAELGDLPVDDCDPAPRCFIVPAWYGGEHGPDLAAVADQLGRTPDEIICAHAAIEHRIFCIGFAPGQPLCGLNPPWLRIPRRDSPRTIVPVGAIGIAERQTTLYAAPTPGGWNLIARTPVRIFDPAADPPLAWQPGDLIRFEPMSDAAFDDPRIAIRQA